MTARLPLAVVALVLALSSLPAAEVAAAVRNVTPSDMTPGPTVDGPLIRVAPPPTPPETPRWRRFFLPATTDAGTFEIGSLRIHVAGVAPPAPDATCTLADGSTWPCGQTALYALRMFLHGRAVECLFGGLGEATEITVPCRVGTTDLAGWLLAAGWAKPAADASDAGRAAANAAACAGRGVWRGVAPPADCRAAHVN